MKQSIFFFFSNFHLREHTLTYITTLVLPTHTFPTSYSPSLHSLWPNLWHPYFFCWHFPAPSCSNIHSPSLHTPTLSPPPSRRQHQHFPYPHLTPPHSTPFHRPQSFPHILFLHFHTLGLLLLPTTHTPSPLPTSSLPTSTVIPR